MSYAPFGQATPEFLAEVHSVVPSCYSEAFDECLEGDNRYAPECARYEPLHVLYEVDPEMHEEIVKDIDYCDFSTGRATAFVVLSAVGAFALGVAVGRMF